jgi:acetyl-CoA C-acetyltransferase
MSNVPHFISLRAGRKFGASALTDGLEADGLTDAFDNCAMGIFAEECARKYDISREEQVI